MEDTEEDKEWDEYEWMRGNYYETRTVGKGRDTYTCEECGKVIRKGDPSETHHFYPEFDKVRTHPKCSKAFLEKVGEKE